MYKSCGRGPLNVDGTAYRTQHMDAYSYRSQTEAVGEMHRRARRLAQTLMTTVDTLGPTVLAVGPFTFWIESDEE